MLNSFQYLKSFRFLCYLLFSIPLFSQKIAFKTIESSAINIEINSMGLDDLVIENSKSNTLEIELYSDDAENHHIVVEEKYDRLYISFEAKEFQEPAAPVMKPITERLKRANAVLKIPVGRYLAVFGLNNNISATNFKGDISISIENGIVKLGEIQQNVAVKLYAGNVFASVEKSNITINSSLGKIKIDDKLYNKKVSLKNESFVKSLLINTIKANVFLSTNK